MFDFDQLPAGAELAAALESVEPTTLDGHQLVDAAVAFQRQLAHLQAGFHAVVAELLHRSPRTVPVHGVDGDSYAGDAGVGALEVAMGWSRRRADTTASTAYRLVDHYPTTLGLLSTGVIEQPVAALISERLHVLDDPADRAAVEKTVTEWIETALVKHNVRKTWAQVNKRLTQAIYRADPTGADNRKARTVAERDAVLLPSRNADDTAALLLSNLAAEDALAAWSRIDGIARTTRTGGDDRTLAQLRADTARDLLLGTTTGTTLAVPTRVQANVDVQTAIGYADNPAILDIFGPVTATTLRNWMTLYADPTGQTFIGVTHRRTGLLQAMIPTDARLFRGTKADALHGLHPSCFWITCDKPSTRCDLDHRDDYATTRITSVDDGAPGCKQHHQFEKHTNGWKLKKLGPTAYEWTSPYGHTYRYQQQPLTDPDPPDL